MLMTLMPKKLWMYCLLVSVVLAALMPIVASIVVVPEEGEDVLNMASIDAKQLESMPSDEFREYVQSIPKKKIEGTERFTYPFTHPQFFHFYFRSAAESFCWLFVATALVSYLGHRSRSRT